METLKDIMFKEGISLLKGADPIEVLKIIKRKARLKTKDFATILDVPVSKITRLLAKDIRLTEDEAKKLATHFDIDIHYFGRWYRTPSDPNYWDEPEIQAEIISLNGYLRFGYEKLIKDYPNHPLIPIWKEHFGEWLNSHINFTDTRFGTLGLLLDTKQAANDEINWLKKEKRKLHAILDEIKKYGITGQP